MLMRRGGKLLKEEEIGVDAKSIGDPLDISKGDATALPLDGADVGAMESAFVRESLLRQTELFAVMSHVAREDVQNVHVYLQKPRGD